MIWRQNDCHIFGGPVTTSHFIITRHQMAQFCSHVHLIEGRKVTGGKLKLLFGSITFVLSYVEPRFV
jgi:hypothetical protein